MTTIYREIDLEEVINRMANTSPEVEIEYEVEDGERGSFMYPGTGPTASFFASNWGIMLPRILSDFTVALNKEYNEVVEDGHQDACVQEYDSRE